MSIETNRCFETHTIVQQGTPSSFLLIGSITEYSILKHTKQGVKHDL